MVTGHMYVNGINREPGLKDFAALLEGKFSNTVHIVVLYHILSKLELRISTTKNGLLTLLYGHVYSVSLQLLREECC